MIESAEVKLHFLDYWRVIKMRLGLISLVFLLIMITAGVTTYFLPRRYLATVRMEVKQDNQKAFDPGSHSSGWDPQFVSTQFQILKMSKLLYPVIDRMELVKYYSGDGPQISQLMAFNRLKGSIDTQQERNTSLIDVGVWDTDRDKAAAIANTISVEYGELRLAMAKEAFDRGTKQFQDEVDKQRANVTAKAQEAARIRQEQGIIDTDPENQGAPLTTQENTHRALENSVNEQKLKVEQLRTALDQIKELKPEALKEALNILHIEDPTVSQNLAELLRSRVDEVNILNSGVGERHPRVVALRAKMAEHSRILQEALDSIRRAKAVELQVQESTLADLQAELDKSQKESIDRRNQDTRYTDAKQAYIQAKQILATAETSLMKARMDNQVITDPVMIYQRAEPPLYAEDPPVRKYLLIASIVGVIVGVLLAFFIEYLDTSVKNIDDVERFLQTTVLAVIPKGIPMLINIPRGDHPDAEAYRILRANLEFNKPSPDAKTVTLISAGPGEGKSTTLNNLAFTCAKGGYNVLVVDADLRRPTQHAYFSTENTIGLTDYLLGKASIDAITRTTKIDNLSFIPSGILPSDAVGILNSQPMTQLIDRLKSQYDLVFFDSPPILGVSDGSVLASEMDMTIMVVQHRRFPRAMLQRVKQAVQHVGGSLIGVVLNNVDSRNDDSYAYYNAYQDYYAAPKREQSTAARRPAPAGASPTPTRRSPVTAATPAKNGENGGNGHHHEESADY